MTHADHEAPSIDVPHRPARDGRVGVGHGEGRERSLTALRCVGRESRSGAGVGSGKGKRTESDADKARRQSAQRKPGGSGDDAQEERPRRNSHCSFNGRGPHMTLFSVALSDGRGKRVRAAGERPGRPFAARSWARPSSVERHAQDEYLNERAHDGHTTTPVAISRKLEDAA